MGKKVRIWEKLGKAPVQASRRELSPSHSCRGRVQVGGSRRFRAQPGRHAVRSRDIEWLNCS